MGVRRSVAVLLLLVASASPSGAQAPSVAALKAAFIINFAKLATWSSLPATAPITICAVGDDEIADRLAAMVPTQKADAHPLALVRPGRDAEWGACQILFLQDGSDARLTSKKGTRALPAEVLTVGDGKDFASSGGMIEFFMEGSKLRFAVNVAEVRASGIVLSSRLLQLARIVGDARAP